MCRESRSWQKKVGSKRKVREWANDLFSDTVDPVGVSQRGESPALMEIQGGDGIG